MRSSQRHAVERSRHADPNPHMHRRVEGAHHQPAPTGATIRPTSHRGNELPHMTSGRAGDESSASSSPDRENAESLLQDAYETGPWRRISPREVYPSTSPPRSGTRGRGDQSSRESELREAHLQEMEAVENLWKEELGQVNRVAVIFVDFFFSNSN